ncbi:MAG: adenylate cyclase [Parasphingorhabdus sp.]
MQAAIQTKLAVVLHADIVDSTRLVQVDEVRAHQHIQDTFQRFSQEIRNYGGIVHELRGDAILAEFPRASDAVSASLSFQKSNQEYSQETSQQLQAALRIGISMGEIVIGNGTLTGAGVVLAQRLEQLAEPGGVCIQGAAYETVPKRFPFTFVSLGEQTLKGFNESIKAYSVLLNESSDVPVSEHTSVNADKQPEMPDKPSIAVLPFNNMSHDPEQEFFADGMAEDVITELSRLPWFFVVARNSSFVYKGRAVDIKQVGVELGVAYVLEGSVRKAGNRLRITAQLIDAGTGNHVWAERYDRDLTDIFEIQDEITQAIINAVAPEFVSAEQKKQQKKNSTDLGAWECLMRGRSQAWKLGKSGLEDSQKLFERAAELSQQRMGLSDLAMVHFLKAFYGWSRDPAESFQLMVDAAENAVASDNHDPLALTILAWSYNFTHKWDKALRTVRRALEISPNFAPAIGVYGAILACAGESEKSIAIVKDAIRRSPRDGFMPIWLMGIFWSYYSLMSYEDALQAAGEGCAIAPDNPTFRRQYLVVCHLLGDKTECDERMADYLRVSPNATTDDALRIPSRDREQLKRFITALINVGLPKGPQTIELYG